ncbi:hypothetical protein FGO68_gene14201 [Halteria grandinella]|uniref:Replication protein A subunit n=1 Tax=Halteria grandinella TaxID=5974 RepID=A0A8J8NX75_HALGN|nr:hypothetical protein FGO68_gene14201 [Halteria grandinella]
MSDGVSQVVTLINNMIFSKMVRQQSEQICSKTLQKTFALPRSQVASSNKLSTTKGNTYHIQILNSIMILTRPPRVIYNDMKLKIGTPRDYDTNVKEEFSIIDTQNLTAAEIPKDILRKHFSAVSESEREDSLGAGESPKKGGSNTSQNTADCEQDKKVKKPIVESMTYTPIKALSTFNYDWRIKARVVKKHEKRTWKNMKSEGSLLNIEMMDQFGTQIQATFFKDAVDKFDPIIREGGIYLFANGQVKLSNSRYTSIKNDFCLVFDRNAEIIEVADDQSIQDQGFTFVTIKDIQEIPEADMRYKIVDVVGVILYVSNDQEINTKAGIQKRKRMISICDETGLYIQVCSWQSACDRLNLEPGKHVIAIKGARVVNNYGKQLNLGDDAYFTIDPPMARTRELLQWFQKSRQEDIKSINKEKNSEREFGSIGSQGTHASQQGQVRLIGEMIESLNQSRMGSTGGGFLSGQYILNCYTTYIRNDEKVFYNACPIESCRKKVQEERGQQVQYKCESCGKVYDTCVPTYMLSAKIADQSNQTIFVNFYREQGQQLMGHITPGEIKDMREKGQLNQISEAFFDAQFRNHQILVKARINQVGYGHEPQGSERIQFFAARLFPHGYGLENKELLRRMEIYKSINQFTDTNLLE